MNVRTGKSLVFVLFLNVYNSNSKPRKCDLDNAPMQEGNFGESKHFKWLGILRVHQHDRITGDVQLALTGLVLVKDKYAVANAADVTRIPRSVFRHDSKASFIFTDTEPWTCGVKSYMVHPEFEFSTYISIALVELDIDSETYSPLEPICWPAQSFNAYNHLYVFGYTDENKLLEKVIYKIQHVNKTMCDEFYNRVGYQQNQFSAPLHYVCGHAVNNKVNCVWENGMVLASNVTGQWVLIGFGVRGPGCAGPARFIEMQHYLPWVKTSTDVELPAYI